METPTVATANLPLLPLSKVMVDVLVQMSCVPPLRDPLGLARQSFRDGPKYFAPAVGVAVR